MGRLGERAVTPNCLLGFMNAENFEMVVRA